MSLTNREQINEVLTKLKIGSILIKRTHDGEKYPRHYFVDERENFVSYRPAQKKLRQPTRYYIHKIDEIRIGYNSRTFDQLVRCKSIGQANEQCAFSIFSNNYRDEVHLIAEDEPTRNMWVQGLQYLINAHSQKRQQHIFNEISWIMNYFYLADKDGSGTLTKHECRRLLLDSLNAKIPTDVFEKYFNEADRSGEGLLKFDEFITFFRLITRRRDLYKIMQKYVKNGENQSIDTISMDTNELLHFLKNVQNQNIIVHPVEGSKSEFSLESISTQKQVQDLINEFEPDIQLRQKSQISLHGFTNLLLSDEFSLMKPWCARYIYQDMTQPLNHYYIKTSHNTYLFNTQVIGDSNPEAYNRVLRAGCRAVEIDCYDGDNGQPIVKHGYTLVKPCLFELIIRFIEPNLFKASPYPVIIDLENHCSIGQRYEIARILQTVLGDQLITAPLLTKDSSVLPSPEDLKYKVLVRGVKIPSPTAIPQLLKPISNENDNSQSKSTKQKVADPFVYFQTVPFLEYKYAKDERFCYHTSSLAEKQFDHQSKLDPLGIIKQTNISSLRVYPDALRQDSSNQNPINPWNFGIQLVALNYQHDDSMMSLSYGKFMDNGACGYTLKPKYLTDIDKTLFNPLNYIAKPYYLSEHINEHPQRFILTIISGQFLPRSNESTTDIPDPYVVVSTHGIPCDQQSHKTKTIDNNGFDPEWNQTFQFDIYFPQMCLIRFDVYDHDTFTKNDRLACFCLPITTIQTGYRHIHLRAKNNTLTCSTLFIHVEIKNI